MKKLILSILMSFVLGTVLVAAQGSISGNVYELQSGEPLAGVRIHIKNRAGLEIGTMQPTYTDEEGYFEVADVHPNDYRMEVTHTFDTADGPMGIRLFTNSDVITVDTSAYVLTIALSKWEAEHHYEKINISRIIQEHKSEVDRKTHRFEINLPDSTMARYNRRFRQNNILRSRITGPKRHAFKFMEYTEPVKSLAGMQLP